MKNIKNVKKVIKHLTVKWLIKRKEKVFNERLKYLFIPAKSDKLLVVFSGFTGDIPKYNYVNSLRDIPINKLYILDDFGYKGSYYLFDNGSDFPQILVIDLIKYIIIENKIKYLITAGSSKGGSCAIYFGIELGATDIYAAACQYYIGTYLSREKHKEIFKAMMGKDVNKEDVDKLDKIICKKIEGIQDESKPKIHLFYSTKELTYERQIIPLLDQLNKCNYIVDEEILDFRNHNDVGIYFPQYLTKQIKI